MLPWMKKKNKTEISPTGANSNLTPPPQICKHTWKDFPWYIEGRYSKYASGSSNYTMEVKEPYVCIYCGKREDKLLERIERDNITLQQADEILQNTTAMYTEYCKPRAVIEDMINDFKLVDPQTLYYYELLHKQTPKSNFATPSSLRTSTPQLHPPRVELS